jgi:crotonobetainyl-CoA:carnitine CoA-transferase CaiB-like acyl-CoA transferase
MLDAAVAFLWPDAFYNHAFQDEPPAAAPEFGAHQKLWRCADGWLTLITPYTEEFAAMCRVFGVADLVADPRFASMAMRRQHQGPLRERLEPILATRGVDDWVAALVAAGVPAGRFNSKAQLASDPQVLHNALLHEVAYPGIGRLRTPRAAAQFMGMPWDASRLAPHLGQHSRELLAQLGHAAVDIDRLLASGAVR